MELFQYPYMQRALIGALVIGLAAPALGIYLVQRRLALIGDGVGHVALTGVGAGLLLNRSPVLVAVVVATLGAVAIELVRARGRTSGDLALALLFYGGIAGGVMLVGLSDATSANLNAYLFGSLTTISPQDLTTIVVLGAAILVTMLALRPALFAVCHDEEYARVAGLPVRALNLLLAVGTAVTVTIAMRAVGVLLISALMVVPVATAQQVTRGFRATMTAAMALGLFAAGSGVWVAANADTAPGASVVLLAIASFLVVAVAAAAWRALRRRRAESCAPAPEPHEVVLR
ncbi:metal ABC transporter permease [Micromonospora carbonacea]|uniref:Metal ABC transporter permease n=1 Tax=Micromonospora carbonacea TaxID=47853 RepID=A0A1C4XQK6_9ACTN|nr:MULTISPECIES: metal ABC transporter permease [Micromonospora]MBB5824895.1 zinc transport system permease protein [Micromonospora carbonacea]MDG4814867.1 metal ABC transporter permease [Micromonospora sp. WMMD956]QLD26971.1 metal ABC transporter permease [Micromonospora carbonacea]WFE57494.1 metal ABC transporter permease [Micromonospora sp. WMMD712]SCF10787.1 zinc transport system permease protein [Micromonospora carbonacea]